MSAAYEGAVAVVPILRARLCGAPRASRCNSRALRSLKGDDSWLEDMITAAAAKESCAASLADAGDGRAAADVNADEYEHDTGDDDDAYDSPYAHGDVDESIEGAFVGAATANPGEVVGEAAVILIGFRPEEWPRVRALVDELGGYDVPVIPARAEHAFATLDEVSRECEPDWESPRIVMDGAGRGGGFGTQRAVAFSGLDLGEIAVLVSAMESQGLSRLVVIVANEENTQKPLGEEFATALKNFRREARRRRGTTHESSVATPASSVIMTVHRQKIIPEIISESMKDLADPEAPLIEAHSALRAVEQNAAREFDDDIGIESLRSPTVRLMTKRDLKALADRRGLSYENLLARAEASGNRLPE